MVIEAVVAIGAGVAAGSVLLRVKGAKVGPTRHGIDRTLPCRMLPLLSLLIRGLLASLRSRRDLE